MTKDEFIEYCKYKGCKLTDDQFAGKTQYQKDLIQWWVVI